VRFKTWNCDKNLDDGKLEAAVGTFRECDFLALQEVGALGDKSSPLVRRAFAEAQGVVYMHGSPPGVVGVESQDRDDDDGPECQHLLECISGVGIVVSTSWTVKKVIPHGSGRALAIVVARGSYEMVVVSVYMPTGLDGCSSSSKVGSLQSLKRATAESIYRWIERITDPYDLALVAGDFNEIRTGSLDRITAHANGSTSVGPARPRESCLMEGFVGRADRTFGDLFRLLHPSSPDGHTHRRPGGDASLPLHRRPMSSSRIDYILVPRKAFYDPSMTWDMTSEASVTEHNILGLTLTTPHLPSAPGATGGTFVPDHPSLVGLTEGELTRLAVAVDREVSVTVKKWESEGPVWSKGHDKRRLDRRVPTLLKLIKRVAAHHCRPPPTATRGGRKGKAVEPLARATAIITGAKELDVCLREIAAGTRAVGDATHKRAVGSLQRLLGFSAGDVTDTDCWARLASLISTDKKLRRSIAGASAASTSQRAGARSKHRELLKRLFAHARGIGEFLNEYLRPASSRGQGLDRATAPDGSVVGDPLSYKPIVRAQVAAPMLTKLHFPDTVSPIPSAPPPLGVDLKGRVLRDQKFESTDLRHTRELPFWYADMHSRNAKGIAADVFANITDKVTEGELRHHIALSKHGVSPGHDGVGIDLIRLLTDSKRVGGATPYVLQAFTLVVNQSLALGYQPKFLTQGWITMVPKVKDDGSFSRDADAMRPITVLPELGKLCTKILASRINDILVRFPDLMNPAQRAFLRDGYLAQATDVVVDVIEDWNEHKRNGPEATPLFLLSYDLSYKRKPMTASRLVPSELPLSASTCPRWQLSWYCLGWKAPRVGCGPTGD
jgi:hypothetical protein